MYQKCHKEHWYLDKVKKQEAQVTQANGDTMSTVDDQSSVMGTTPTTNGTSSKGTGGQGAKRPSWQGLRVHKSGTIHTHSYAQTNKHMYNWILLGTCSSIDCFCNQSFMGNVHQVNTTLSIAMNAGTMMTTLKAELPGYGTVWFYPNIPSDISKNWIHFKFNYTTVLIFLAVNKVITFMSGKDINPKRISTDILIPRECFSHISDIKCPNY